MNNNNINNKSLSPSDFYRQIRPEYFSDSEITYDIVLPKELLEFELSKITTNQKEAEFETLCRKIIEKTIAPNLIPQVGPTGGGDGKTDSETYPVSDYISERWFIPENGWNKDEKWAFAFSAKQDWKTKATSDIDKIVQTNRAFTKIFFVTNQTPSSKQKKDFQDKCSQKYSIEVIALDAKWIIEKIYSDNLLEIAISSLNLSETYKSKKIISGKNDAEKNKKLEELENNINNQNRYFEYDFQLIEDALESAVLSRQLEKPRNETEGRFDRALRFCKKLKSDKHFIRIYYQRAWTFLYYYSDYQCFIDAFTELKKYISSNSSISEIELYLNLFNSLKGIIANVNFLNSAININEERKNMYSILNEISAMEQKPCSALIAKVYISLEKISDSIIEKTAPEENIQNLSKLLSESVGYVDFPFDAFRQVIEQYGKILSNNFEYDKLIDNMAAINEKRTSELSAGQIFLKRGCQKFVDGYYKESIIYFGKAIFKLSKEEHKYEMSLALRGLGNAYGNLGLYWASNNCFVTAASIAIKSWYEKGVIDKKLYECNKQLIMNELIIGRIPQILVWNELFKVISTQIENENNDDDNIPTPYLIEGCLTARLLNDNFNNDENFSYFPDILGRENFLLAQDAVLYKLGYGEQILPDYKKSEIYTIADLDKYFELCANQPFRKQILYETNFLSDSTVYFSSNILGCTFKIVFEKDIELLFAAETLLAFFESFLATSLHDVYANTEQIQIRLIRDTNERLLIFSYNGTSTEYQVKIDKINHNKDTRGELINKIIELIAHILGKSFFFKDGAEVFLTNLFKKEEIHERQTFVLEHRNFTINILGEKPKVFFEDWKNSTEINHYQNTRTMPLIYTFKEDINKDKQPSKIDFENVRHNEMKVSSIIIDELWNKAKWQGFGLVIDGLNPYNFMLFLAFEDGETGKKIFERWIEKFGKEDNSNSIRITIIKGVNKNKPHWYRVHITSNIQNALSEHKERYIIQTARFHEMAPDNPKNLNNIESYFKHHKKYTLIPAQITASQQITPFFEKSIIKYDIEIKNAWEIGLNDIAKTAIKKGDNPVIPDNIKNAPVLEVLKK
jgi:hypothetical protein